MKIITFLLLIIAVNCKGQDSLTAHKLPKGVEVTLGTQYIGSITRGPAYISIIGSRLLFLMDKEVKDTKLWYINGDDSFDMVAWMNPDSSIVIKDTMATIMALLKHISLREQEVKKLYDLQYELYNSIRNIYRGNYVIDKKKRDKVVNGHK